MSRAIHHGSALGSSFAGAMLSVSGVWDPYHLDKLEKWNPPPGDLKARADHLVKTLGYLWSNIHICPTLIIDQMLS